MVVQIVNRPEALVDQVEAKTSNGAAEPETDFQHRSVGDRRRYL